MKDQILCQICGEPMPKGEELFMYHGYSGPCPKPRAQKMESLLRNPDIIKKAAKGANEMQRKMMDFAKAYDWKGLARAFHEGNIEWHAKEWEELFKKIGDEKFTEGYTKASLEDNTKAYQEGRESMKKERLNTMDNKTASLIVLVGFLLLEAVFIWQLMSQRAELVSMTQSCISSLQRVTNTMQSYLDSQKL